MGDADGDWLDPADADAGDGQLPATERPPDAADDELASGDGEVAATTQPRRRRSDASPRDHRRRARDRRRDAQPTAERRGRREERRAGARRRRRTRGLRVATLVVVLATVGVVVVVLATGLVDRALDLVGSDPADDGPTGALQDPQPSVVLVSHDPSDPSGQASAIALLAVDRATGEGTVVLVPAATVADVPGFGSFPLGEAYAFGQGPLVGVSLDNLLGLRSDAVATVSPEGWEALLGPVGDVEVDVRTRLVRPPAGQGGGGAEVRFEAGPQRLEGSRLVEFLLFRQEDETELEALPRVQQVLHGLLDAIADDPGLLGRVLPGDGAAVPGVGSDDPVVLRTVLQELAEARGAGRLTTLTLPVTPLGTGREDVYRVDTDRLQPLLDGPLAASRLRDGVGVGQAVQILNGNGVPGIGQQVAAGLRDGGYRIVLTGNADSFDHELTRILVYGVDERHLAVARDVQERLGVGVVEQAATPQSVVDVTIIVGADFGG